MPADNDSYDLRAQPEDEIGGASPAQTVGTDDTHVFADHTRWQGFVLSYLTDDKTVEGLTVRSATTQEAGPAQQFAFPGGRRLYTVVPTSRIDGDSLVTVHRTTGDERPRRF
jgi:hypothetical protein